MKNSNSIIQSLDRGMAILEIVAESKRPVSINELTNVLGIDRSSVFRLANTLLQRGLLMVADGTRSYVLGYQFWKLSNQYPWIETFTHLASDLLKELAVKSGETAHIAIRQGNKTLIVNNEMSAQALNVRVRSGDEGLLHCTSVGKALLLDYNEDELRQILGADPLLAPTENTMTSVVDLYLDLQQSRKQGFTFDDQEYIMGVRCVAAPIRDHSGNITAALGLSAPLERLPDSKVKGQSRLTMEIAKKIGEKLKPQNNMKQDHISDNSIIRTKSK